MDKIDQIAVRKLEEKVGNLTKKISVMEKKVIITDVANII